MNVAPTPLRRLIEGLIIAFAWGVLAASLAGLGGRLAWPLGLFAPFRLQGFIAAWVAVTAVLLLLRRRRITLVTSLIAAVAAGILNLCFLLPLWSAPDHSAATGPTLTVMAVNLHVGNHRLDDLSTAGEIAAMIERCDAPIILVQEITMHRLGVLSRTLKNHRLVAGTGRPDAFGIALFVKVSEESQDRLVVESAREVDMSDGLVNVRQVELLCRWRDRPLAFLGMHTISAVHARSDRFRIAMMAGAARWSQRQQADGRAVLIAGDLNATPFCPPFRDLLVDGHLLDSSRFGFQGTWPASLPAICRIPIDHAVHSPDLIPLRRDIGAQSAGSDHLPLIVEVQWIK